jgi:hypothetical protein
VTNGAGVLAALDRCAANLRPVASVLVDGGYTGEDLPRKWRSAGKQRVQVVARDQLRTFVVPQVLNVERSGRFFSNRYYQS